MTALNDYLNQMYAQQRAQNSQQSTQRLNDLNDLLGKLQGGGLTYPRQAWATPKPISVKAKKVFALWRGAATDGEKQAAATALERMGYVIDGGELKHAGA